MDTPARDWSAEPRQAPLECHRRAGIHWLACAADTGQTAQAAAGAADTAPTAAWVGIRWRAEAHRGLMVAVAQADTDRSGAAVGRSQAPERRDWDTVGTDLVD